MTTMEQALVPAEDLAALNGARFPNESAAYGRRATRSSPRRSSSAAISSGWPGCAGRCPRAERSPPDYGFVGENGPVTLSELFGDKETLVIYSYMFGPERKRPCPMCTSFMGSFEGKIPDVEQRVALAFVARSPIERLAAFKKERGWTELPIYSDPSGAFTRTYVSAEDADVPGYTVFTRRDGTIRHFYSGEISGAMADPGQDPRGAPDLDPLWNLLDTTPEGRGDDWYPKLDYPARGSDRA